MRIDLKNNDGRVVDYEPLASGEHVFNYKSGRGSDKIKEVDKSMPSQLGVFVPSQNIRIMNMFVRETDGFYSNKLYCQDTDSLYIHMDHHEEKKEIGNVGNNLGQGENGYGDCGIFYGLFLAPEMKICYTLDKYGTLGEKLTLRCFHDTKNVSTLKRISK